MKFIWQEMYDQMQSIVSRCWFEPNGHGLPPAFTSVLAGCQVGLHRVVYGASVDELGKWHFPEFQGDENDVTVLFWMPKPEVTMRFDTAFAFRADTMEAILYSVNREAQAAEAIKRAEVAEARVKELEALPVTKLLHTVKDHVPAASLMKEQDRELAELRQRAEIAEERLAAALGADKPDKPATPTERARHWAMEACDQKRRADAAEARVKELEGALEHRNAAENRMWDGLERLTNSDELDSNPTWNPAADLEARGGKRINDPRHSRDNRLYR